MQYMETTLDDSFLFNTEDTSIFSVFPKVNESSEFLLDSPNSPSREKDSSSNSSSPYNPHFPREDKPFVFNNGMDTVDLDELLHPVGDFTVDLNTNNLGLSNFFNEQVSLGNDNGSSDSRVVVEDTNSQQTDSAEEEVANTPERSPEKPKKKRGRPKKADDNKQPKKKRGRPRKVKEDQHSDEETISDENEKGFKFEEEKKPYFGEKIDLPPVGEAFAFKKKELLELTSVDIDRYYELVTSVRKLTEEEEKRYKKHNRLVRNRESAQKSRMKKRQYVDKLEAKIRDLERQRSEAEAKLEERNKENEFLRQENLKLRSRLGISEKEKVSFDKEGGKKNALLFAIVFSFALFVFGGLLGVGLKPLTPQSALTSLTPLSRVSVESDAHFSPSNKRHLSSSVPENESHTVPTVQNTHPLPSHNHKHSHNHESHSTLKADSPIVADKSSIASPPLKLDSSPAQEKKDTRKKISVNSATSVRSLSSPQQESDSDLPENSIVTTSSNGMVRRKHNSSPIARPEYDDASYIYCSEAKHISRGSSKSPVVGFLIPTNFLNGTNLMFDDAQRPPLVEVTCSVMDIYPVYPIAHESSKKH